MKRVVLSLAISVICCFSAIGQVSITDSVATLIEQHKLDSALLTIHHGMKKYSDVDSVYALLAEYKADVHLEQEYYDSIFYIYLDVYEKFPEHPSALGELVILYGDNGMFDEAFFFLDLQYDLNFRRDIVFNNYAYYNGLAGNYEKSLLYCDSTLQIASTDHIQSATYNNRGYALMKLGKFKEAKRSIEKSLEILPTNSFAYRNLALIYLEANEPIQACKALAKSREYGGVNISQMVIDEYKLECK